MIPGIIPLPATGLVAAIQEINPSLANAAPSKPDQATPPVASNCCTAAGAFREPLDLTKFKKCALALFIV